MPGKPRRCVLGRRRGLGMAPLLTSVAALTMTLTGCSSPEAPAPTIQVAVLSFPPGQAPAGYHAARAVVLDRKTGESLGGAEVEINGTTLAFQESSRQYEGDVELPPGEDVRLRVVVRGHTYLDLAEQFGDYPTIVAPAPGEALHTTMPSSIRWTLGTLSLPNRNAGIEAPLLGVFDAADPDGALVWPPNDRDLFQVSAGDRFRIDDPLSPGSRIVVVGKRAFFPTGFGAGSSFVVGAFAARALTVSSATLSSLSISPSPAGFAFGAVGAAGVLKATGTFSDGTLQDLSELVTWDTGDHSVATIDSLGQVVAVQPGATTVSASYGGLLSSAPLTISVPQIVQLNFGPRPVTVNRLVPTRFSATGTDSNGTFYDVTELATWTSADPTIAVVSDAPHTKGLVTGMGPGTVSIQASVGSVDAGEALTVSEWALRDAGTSATLQAVIWAGTQFVAVGNDPAGAAVLTSPDGLVWASHPPGVTEALHRIAWSGSTLLAIGGGPVLTSPDGVTWTKQTLAPILSAAAWSGTRWVGVGLGGLLSSEDGVTWTDRSTRLPDVVAWYGTQFVAVGNAGVFTSPDGLTWTDQSGSGPRLTDIASSATRLVGAGLATLATSTDGIHWTMTSLPPGLPMPEAVIWNGREWMTVGRNATVVGTSSDGQSWTGQPIGTADLWGVASSGTRDVAVGSDGTVLTRP